MRMVVGERGGDKERERKCKNVPIVVGKAMGKSVKNGAGISKELWMLHVVKKFQSKLTNYIDNVLSSIQLLTFVYFTRYPFFLANLPYQYFQTAFSSLTVLNSRTTKLLHQQTVTVTHWRIVFTLSSSISHIRNNELCHPTHTQPSEGVERRGRCKARLAASISPGSLAEAVYSFISRGRR